MIRAQLSDLKLISEPWDCGGLYKLENFPAKRFRTWNGHFRDDIRKFWKGEKSTIWRLKDRLCGHSILHVSDPKLSDVKLISEPWDCGGLYKLGDFPATKFRTWNGHFRDDVRRFWKGEKSI